MKKKTACGALLFIIIIISISLSFCGHSSSNITTSAAPQSSAVKSDTQVPQVSDSTDAQASSSADAQASSSTAAQASSSTASDVEIGSIPDFSGLAYVEVNNNAPYFTDEEMTTNAFETYGDLDQLGRCGVAYANVCQELMPTEERGKIGSVKPSGWHTVKYDCVDGKYLYNRCHLIGYQLTGENANKRNLITGTRYLNVEGMLPFENMVADYVKETNKHVLYRVSPIFTENDLVASGVLMEAKSVEDNGSGVQFCVYCYNVQPGVDIDYSSGDSSLSEER